MDLQSVESNFNPRNTILGDMFLSAPQPRETATLAKSKIGSVSPSIIVDHQPLVRNAAKQFQNKAAAKGVSLRFEDLVQEANIALLVTLQTYDPAKAAFATYARRAIVWAFLKYEKDNRDLGKRGRGATRIADKSLNEPAHDFDGRPVEFGDTLADESLPDPIEVIHAAKCEAVLAEAIQLLSPRELSILEARHLSHYDGRWKFDQRLLDVRGPTPERVAKLDEPFKFGNAIFEAKRPTLTQLGKKHKISGERARQIGDRAFEKVKAHLIGPPREAA